MELTWLTTFRTVAEAGNFTRAAERLHLTQPAVSGHVQALEADLGVPLFDRSGRTIRLTQAGERVYRYASRIGGLLEDCRRELADLSEGTTGYAAVGATDTLTAFFLPDVLGRFRRTHPGVAIRLHTGLTEGLVDALIQDRLDLAVVPDPGPHPGLERLPLLELELAAVLPPDHPLASASSVDVRDLALQPLVLYERGCMYRGRLEQAWVETGRFPETITELGSLEGIRRSVVAGLGLSVLPLVAVEADGRAGTLVVKPLAGVDPRIHVVLALHAGRYRPGPVRALLSELTAGRAAPLGTGGQA
ncbi:LysR family transcriptional regulator [Limnochorda pilosa]|uniref:LysR family transcriptional regulator n=1 Tax=Limnochorda pilosa TaxID=1555112 RepID=A0A0K2SH12_LIMPI|nr:LysR family transcriptional regulator [Limnochorda pilosa]BAS26403.1 LysR family transcriptional regulator [Limnochorda pilosa]